ncbi:MAG: hypothetical protein ABH864_01720 [archaeon]
MKIQQMAFMLVAIMIFFAMVAIVYFTIVLAKVQGTADDLREQEAKELARQMSGTPELTFSQDGISSSSTIDLDKAYILAKTDNFKRKYWNLDYLMIERIYPETPAGKENCLQTNNYPNCRELVLIDKTGGNYSGTMTSPIALARWDQNIGSNGIGGYRFELGRIHTLAHDPTN